MTTPGPADSLSPDAIPDPPGPGEVRLWTVRLDREPGRLPPWLSDDELERAGRFVRLEDRRRFLCGRLALRRVLGRWLDVAPAQLAFSYGELGRPGLASPSIDLSFNLSHSGDVGLCAAGYGVQVGVDLEHQDRLTDYEPLIRSFFTPGEAATVDALPPSARRGRFLTLWTAKEALLKAWGRGLSGGTDAFELEVVDDQARLLSVPDDLDPAQWNVAVGMATPGTVGAVAVWGDPGRVTLSWPDPVPGPIDPTGGGAGLYR